MQLLTGSFSGRDNWNIVILSELVAGGGANNTVDPAAAIKTATFYKPAIFNIFFLFE